MKKNMVILLLLSILVASCSDPIFWVLQNEIKIERSNLPKDTVAAGFGQDSTYYYAMMGPSVWRKSIAEGFRGSWTRLAQEGNVRAMGGLSYALFNGSGAISGLTLVQLGAGEVIDKSGAVVSVIPGVTTDGALTSSNGEISLSGSRKVGGSTRALLDLNGSPVVGLFASSTGFGEIVNGDNSTSLALRSPTTVVSSNDDYVVSNLARANVVGFWQDTANPDIIFVLTSNFGLWRIQNRTLYWE
jgi:hypothetical protein